jgi:hypothetical protein
LPHPAAAQVIVSLYAPHQAFAPAWIAGRSALCGAARSCGMRFFPSANEHQRRELSLDRWSAAEMGKLRAMTTGAQAAAYPLRQPARVDPDRFGPERAGFTIA